ncbi:CoA-substrate-specific enzyme activase [Ferroglobus placidus DSM 10642]|uniref:CoA-substrate-specific enzyme activase n=1 Tax=Ferroglobus placidus (strain DSM 10642 / AEDII12DO) TaxID=589924 RepID=D3RXY1_FERPA|nr:acyl-CoA dehydratase activase [Ferroglobus placidus]ADC65344.1 CoA-substrate-specific enzyme activase [Ferroglobus placidus DSM 10642]QCO91681.1 CoA activase [synthetic construct]
MFVGVDVGSKYTKVVVMNENKEVLSYVVTRTGTDLKKTSTSALEEAVEKAGISLENVKRIVATGFGKIAAPFADDETTQVIAAAKGAYYVRPSTRTVIEVGAEESRAISLDDNGNVKDFALADKCAAGAGSFVDAMVRYLEVTPEEFGRLALQATKSIPMNAQCVIFAESEVVSLLHANVPKAEISRAIHDAIADRVASIARRLEIRDDVLLIGGLANDVGFIDAMKRELEREVYVPENYPPEVVPAIGAAIVALETYKG